MAIRRIEDISKEAEFGRRLFTLACNHDLKGPAQVAKALYENDECFKLVRPKETKHEDTKKENTATIARAVQRHFNSVSARDVPGSYMMAYSKLFNCSMDYLYGLIDIESPNAEIADICKKTGLSPKAVENLMSGAEICIEDYLTVVERYGLLETGLDAYNGYDPDDPDAEDEFLETYQPVSKFWSNVLESNQFTSLPENWYRMACALYTSRGVKMVADAAETERDMPSIETFKSRLEDWNIFHDDRPVYIPNGMTLEEIYEKDPDWVSSTYREMLYEEFYSASDKKEDYETAYWGCAGRFDRATQDYFHKCADEWCDNGPLPPIDRNQKGQG